MRSAPEGPRAAFIFDGDQLLVESESPGCSTMTAVLRSFNPEWQPAANPNFT